jgi:outer membrane protein OmpA-like peptidoglycan-associated protein
MLCRKILFLGFGVLICISLNAQKGTIKKADKKFNLGEYEMAIDLYKKAAKGNYRGLANMQIAECYRLSNRANLAEPYYEAAIAAGIKDETAQYYYAYALKANGKYEAAEKQMDKYLATATNFEFIEKGQKELDNLQMLGEITARKSFYEIKNYNQINTIYAEYAPIYKNGNFYFSSSRGEGRVYKATGQSFTDIYKVPFGESGMNRNSVEALKDIFNDPNINEGAVAFTPDGRTMIFAKGNTGKRKGDNDVNLYISYFRNGNWTEPRKLPINDINAWDSTPAFNRTGRRLYFSSNRDGGYGGTDIYEAVRDANGRWGNVRNMGNDINTAGNEMFPYVNRDGKLYFASTGHPGMGGLDLFKAERLGGKTIIKNLGVPINSSYDDFALTYAGPLNGFFTSNRPEGKGDDDIYTFVNNDPDYKIINYYLAGKTITRDEGNDNILAHVRVRLLDSEGNLLERTTTRDDGTFKFEVEEDDNYFLVGEKADYLTTREIFSTMGRGIPKEKLTKFETNITFDTLLVLENVEINKVFVLENIYYDLDKAFIRPDAAVELDKLVEILSDNPGITIELSSHTDTRADLDYNLDLSQRRAESAVNYIISNGIDAARLIAKGYGETDLIVKDEEIAKLRTEEAREAAHQRNRRTQFRILTYERPEEIEEDDELEGDIFDN